MIVLFKRKKFVYENDLQLVEALKANDEAAIKYVFYDHYRSKLKAIAKFRIKSSPVEYDDLIQELYLYFAKDNWKRLEKYDCKRKFENWFLTSSSRYFRDCCKKWVNKSTNFCDVSAPENPIVNRTVLSDWYNTELMRDIIRVLPFHKPEYERDIFTALVVNLENPEEVAKKYGKTVEQVQRTKRKALAKITKNLLTGYIDK